MKILLINLERNPERLSRMSTLLSDMQLPFERIDAVDGKCLSTQEQARWSQSHADGSPFLSPSEVGCYLSHRIAWAKIAGLESDFGLVLEDDLHFAEGCAGFFSTNDWIPDDADVVKVETVFWKTLIGRSHRDIGNGYSVTRLHGQHFGMAGYIISPGCARTLLNLGALDRAIDQIFFDPASGLFHDLTLYQAMPAFCVQDQFIAKNHLGIPTNIERGWDLKSRRRALAQKVGRELSRPLSQLRDIIVGRLLSPFTRKKLTKIGFRPYLPPVQPSSVER
ncbi:glycosyltransferase family 25 protein [Shinella sp. NM-101]|uniref:glycosyltransferase family 25 protein n=1 Tax=Shinella sp. NM-101 TaxID=2744455 RepID=UPI001F25752D|nr:glycosyltransferase family 25 protein [Shinella sp. NM-101]